MAPRLGDLAAFRHAIGADDVAVFTNITPEFSRSVSGRPVAERARSAAFLGVDALLVSGQMAGVSAELADLRDAREAVPQVPVLANTGVDEDNAERILKVADGLVVGTSLKVDGGIWNPVDPARARRLVELVGMLR
jgi:predicted TIM-barrel enzyme